MKNFLKIKIIRGIYMFFFEVNHLKLYQISQTSTLRITFFTLTNRIQADLG